MVVKDLYNDLTGKTAAGAATDSANIQVGAINQAIPQVQQAGDTAQSFLMPYQQLGQQGLDQAGFLTNPQAQFDFLQNNPLFQSALNNANTQTQNMAAAQGRLSAGDTLQQLSQNTLLAASPLINQQKQSISGLINTGLGVAGNQANIAQNTGFNIADLITSRGATQAGGVVGAANAETQGTQNLLKAGLTIGGLAMSDRRLKTNIKPVGEENGFNTYTWDWNKKASELFDLGGQGFGVIADEVKEKYPEAVFTDKDGYMSVNYDLIGVHHGG